VVDPGKRRKFNIRLRNWYKRNSRSFPWRQHHELYPLLTAEILLQRTNADKVVPAYLEILRRYPTPDRLMRSWKKTLERIIQPLGLIGKAETLRSLAKELVIWDDSDLSRDKLLKLRGVGEYIASSIIIHVQGKRCPILDPNIIRIYKRVFGISSNLSRPRCDKALWQKTLEVIPQKNVSQYVYALLDFGALICRARNPLCLDCPMFDDVCLGVDSSVNHDRRKSQQPSAA
jgi:A/G-specific adenine glycosylase